LATEGTLPEKNLIKINLKITMKVPFIDLNAQYQAIKDEVDAALDRVIQKSSFVLGEEVEKFEKEFAEYCGAKYCLGTNSGTSALHLALLGLGIKPGDEIITQPNTFFATAEAISYMGAKPIFVDAKAEDYMIDEEKIEAAITPKAKCLLPVHLFGNAAKMEKILAIAQKYNLAVVEDVCQGHGVVYQGKKLGTFGKVGCFSFYPGKVLGAFGEGGAVVTSDKDVYEKMKIFRDHGQSAKNNHEVVGYNYRLEGIQGAVLGAKLKKLDTWLESRRNNARLYNELLRGTEVATPSEEGLRNSNVQYYVIRCPNRDALKEYLAQNGVTALIHYPTPIHLQKAYEFLGYKAGDFPNAEKAAKEMLSLPMYPELSKDAISYVASLVKEFYKSL
jgi:dTDP-4-amino-4,6-dideoxygalactose transaminase